MCGIVGGTGDQRHWIEAATRSLRHRGPDRWSVHAAQDVQLGHARLAVIDLSESADQPMFSADGSAAIVFNGEFYNFQEERERLLQAGQTFRTQSDTEVLLRLYETEGDACLSRLNGMFAFAIWDARAGRLLLARDRLGEKPLYYSRLTDGNLLFASEIKALLLHPAISRQLDICALDDYLTYLYIPAPRTAFSGISKLLPGERLVWRQRQLSHERYWRLPETSSSPRGDDETLASEIESLLRQSVRQRLVADVPVGIYLSGGIDSSSIVALAADTGSRLKTFTVTFGEEGGRYDERSAARRVARHYGTEHHELCVSGACTDRLPAIVRHFDQPFGNPTALLAYEISRITRDHVTVVLGGDGGDEVFGGYPRYRGIRWAARYRRVPLPIRAATARLATLLPESKSGFHTPRRAKEFLTGTMLPWEQMYVEWVGYCTSALKQRLFSKALRDRLSDHQSERFVHGLLGSHHKPFLDRAMRCDLQSFLPENILEYGDKMSMAHGLELRLPMLDPALVGLLSSLPASQKLRGGKPKHLLKLAMASRLPAWVLRRRKIGFNPPMGIWIERELRSKMAEYLAESQVRRRGYFEPDAVAMMQRLHRSGRRDYSLHLWALLVFEEWHRQYLD